MSRTLSFKHALALSCACAFAVSACSSKGTTRVSTLGQTRSVEKAGPQGPQGEQGPAGAQGSAGADGADGGINIGETDPMIITGTTRNLLAGISLEADEITGKIIGVADETGQTLLQTDTGDLYSLVDANAVLGDVITASLTEATLLGNGESLLGVSLLAGEQQGGDAATFGIGSGGELLTFDQTVTSDPEGAVSGALASTTGVTEALPVGGLDGDVVGDLTGDLGGGLTGDLTGDLTDTVGDLLDDPTGTLEDTLDTGDGLVGGLLGNN